MVRFALRNRWDNKITEGRECGNCYACCVYLGVEEIKKPSNHACVYLDHKIPTKRCSIYDDRPKACAEYRCFWRMGFGPEWLKPNRSGVLITMYDGEVSKDKVTVTINIIDDTKLSEHRLTRLVADILMMADFEEVRVVNVKQKKGTLFKDGNIYACRLLPPDGYESLVFEAEDRPIGGYKSA